MRIRLYSNDSGLKNQSFEACVGFNTQIGFGDSKESAIKDLKRKLFSMITDIQNINFENPIIMDHAGKEIK